MSFLDPINQEPVTPAMLQALTERMAHLPVGERTADNATAIGAVELGMTPEQCVACIFRLAAAEELLQEPLPGWRHNPEAANVLLQPAILAAAAAEPMIERKGRASFDRRQFALAVIAAAHGEPMGPTVH